MGTIVAYSSSPITEVSTLPVAPSIGTQIRLSSTGETFIFQNGLWVGIEGSSYIYDYEVGVVATSAIVLVSGEAQKASATTHNKCDGICAYLFDGKAVVRTSGVVGGFSDLVVSSNYYLSTTSGSIVTEYEGGNVVLIGTAISSSSILLKLGVGVSTQ